MRFSSYRLFALGISILVPSVLYFFIFSSTLFAKNNSNESVLPNPIHQTNFIENLLVDQPIIEIDILDNDVILTWSPVVDAVSYRVYRNEAPYLFPFGSPIATTSSTTISNNGALLERDAFYYRITAVDSNGNESAPSNEVGYFNIEVVPGFNLLAWPLLPIDTSLDAVLGTQLFGTENPQTADRILVWDANTQTYDSAWFCGGPVCETFGDDFYNHWLANDFSQSPLTIEPDNGFWLQNRSGVTETLTLVGDVAVTDRPVSIQPGYQMLGLSFSDVRTLDTASLPATGTEDPQTGDRILYWDAMNQTYDVAWFCGGPVCETFGEDFFNRWLANDYSPSNIELQPGRGFWFQNRHDSLSWTASIPPLQFADLTDRDVPLGSTLNLSTRVINPSDNELEFSVTPLPLFENASYDPSTGFFSFKPSLEQIGTYSLTFSVTDGTNSIETPITLTVPEPDPNGTTALEGRLLDANDAELGITTPLVGATITHIESGLTTTTDFDGYFFLAGLPAGLEQFDYDASTAAPIGVYGGYRGDVDLIYGVTNIIDRPIYIMGIDPAGVTTVDPDNTTMLENLNIDVSIEIPPNTVKDEEGSDYEGEISVSQVPSEFTPSSLPDELEFGFVVTIQPMGLDFAEPAPVSFPNQDNLPPGSLVDLWSLDHDTGQFFVAGQGEVSLDGSQINTIEGGIQESSWHSVAPPRPAPPPALTGGEIDSLAADQTKGLETAADQCFASTIGLYDGCLQTEIMLPAYQSLSQNRGLEFVYKSSRAYSQHFIPFEAVIPNGTAIPPSMYYQTTLNGVVQDDLTYIDTTNLGVGGERDIRSSIRIDTSQMETGAYPLGIRLTSDYGTTRVSASLGDNAIVVNESESPFGAGWGLAGLERIYPQTNGDVLVTQGEGTAQLFSRTLLDPDELFLDRSIRLTTDDLPVFAEAIDLNNDELLDIIVPNQNSGNLNLFFGELDGGYSSSTTISVGIEPVAIAIADFNKDDWPDIVVVNRGSNNIDLLFGDGTGFYEVDISIGVGSSPRSVVIEDFNTDGELDIATINFTSNDITILEGDGIGGFSLLSTITTDTDPLEMKSADLNNDDIADLAYYIANGQQLIILLGLGDGTFIENRDISSIRPYDFVFEDFNNDKLTDIFVMGAILPSSSGLPDASIFLGNGTNTFTRTAYLNNVIGNSLVVDDFNLDGFKDIVSVTNATNTTSPNILPDGTLFYSGLGDGTFNDGAPTAIGESIFHLISPDLNFDGTPDLIAVNGINDYISVHEGTGNGHFSSRDFFVGDIALSATNEDVNLDGNIDLIVSVSQGSNKILLGDGEGSFTERRNFSDGGTFGTFVTVSDFNNDLLTDILVINQSQGTISILLGDGSGNYNSFSNLSVGSSPREVAIADYDGDDIDDLAITIADDDIVKIFIGDGSGAFSELTSVAVGDLPWELKTADFDQDDIQDLAVNNFRDSNIEILLGDGSGNFTSSITLTTGLNSPDFHLSDIDDDGFIDVSILNDEEDNIFIYYGQESGAFSPSQIIPIANVDLDIDSADLNQDGLLDLIIATRNPDGLVVLINTDNRTFGDPFSYPLDWDPDSITIGQYNDDNTPDIAVANENNVTIFLTNPAIRLTSPNGDYSSLLQNEDGTYTHEMKDGTVHHFDTAGFHTETVDRNGNVTQYGYDGNGRLITITDPAVLLTTLTYNNGYLDTVTDPANRTTQFIHDGNGDLIEVVYPDNANMLFGYDGRHLMTSETDKRGETTTRMYDEYGRILQATLPDSTVRETTSTQSIGWVDPASGLGIITNPAPLTQQEAVVSTLVDGEDRTTETLPGPLGRPQVITEATGLVTTIIRDNNGNPLQTTLPSGVTYVQTFDTNGNLRTFTDPTTGGTTTFTYDQTYNNITSIRDPLGAVTRYIYDDQGNLIQSTTPLGQQFNMSYDDQGLITLVTDTLGTESTISYDLMGNPVLMTQGAGAEQRSTEFAYTSAGYVSAITDTIGQSFGYQYDAFGRLTEETLPGNRTITYGYDDGHLTAITPPSQPVHTFGYNQLGLLETYTAPTVSDGGTHQTSYQYDNSQLLDLITRPDGFTLDYGYDFGGRLQSLTIPRGTISYGYNSTSGQLVTIDAPNSVSLSYGYSGELLTSMSWAGPINGNVTFAYDANYNIVQDSVNGNPITYAYNLDSDLVEAGELSFVYDLTSGLPLSATLDNIQDDWQFNQFVELSDHTSSYLSSTLYAATYGRDGLGRIVTKTETISGTTTSFEYRYDAAGRLHEVLEDGQLADTYIYDDNGNRLSHTNGISNTVTGVYDAQDRLLQYGDATFTYTPNGELLTKSVLSDTTAYNYDVLGNLIEITLPNGTVISYEIDGENRRIGKRVDGTLVQGFLYRDTLNPIAELDGGGNVVSRFVYGNRINVPEYMIKDGITYRIITDHLGSVRLVVNANTGEVAQQLTYDAWGVVIENSNPGFQPFGYAGGIYDAETGLVRFGARDYDAETGRWTAKDPIRFDGGTNQYVYAYNSPLNFVDVEGTIPLFVAGALIGGVIGAISNAYAAYQTCQDIGAAAFTGFLGGAVAGGSGIRLGLALARGGLHGGVASFIGGAGGGFAGEGFKQYLENDFNPASLFLSTALGGVGGNIFNKLIPTRGFLPRSGTTTFGPNSNQILKQTGASSGAGAILSTPVNVATECQCQN